MNVLLHLCCANCGIIPLQHLRALGHKVTGFFYNHNIHPYQEYVRRRDTVRQWSDTSTLPLIERDAYDLDQFLAAVAAQPTERCSYCYRSRLRVTATAAVAGGFDAFTSSLLYSRYQQHDAIRQYGLELAEQFGLTFVYSDWRTGWNEGIRASKALGLYRQQYCGCIYSEYDRYRPRPEGS